MALNQYETIQIQIVGLITSVEYQKAIATAKVGCNTLSSAFNLLMNYN